MSLDLTGFDFVDFGSSRGGSVLFAQRCLGGKRGLGIDIDPKKVAVAQSSGIDASVGDITQLNADDQRVRFVTMMHILEHLPSDRSVFAALQSAVTLASDFLYISGPNFDDDEYLQSFGLKWFWSDWHGHRCHLTTVALHCMLNDLGLTDRYLLRIAPVESSTDPALHSIHSPRDQGAYDPGNHPPKPLLHFDRPLFKEFICIARIRPFADWARIIQLLTERFGSM